MLDVLTNSKATAVTCADPRCHPEHYFDLGICGKSSCNEHWVTRNGLRRAIEAVVFRGAGGRVTPSVLKDIVAIDTVTGNVLEAIAVVHHTGTILPRSRSLN